MGRSATDPPSSPPSSVAENGGENGVQTTSPKEGQVKQHNQHGTGHHNSRGRGVGRRGMKKGGAGRGAGREREAKGVGAKHEKGQNATGAAGATPGSNDWYMHDDRGADAAKGDKADTKKHARKAEQANGHHTKSSSSDKDSHNRNGIASEANDCNLKVSVEDSGTRKVVVVDRNTISNNATKSGSISSGWFLKDPKGGSIGPCSANELISWFEEGLQVRHSQSNSWEQLKSVMSKLKKTANNDKGLKQETNSSAHTKVDSQLNKEQGKSSGKEKNASANANHTPQKVFNERMQGTSASNATQAKPQRQESARHRRGQSFGGNSDKGNKGQLDKETNSQKTEKNKEAAPLAKPSANNHQTIQGNGTKHLNFSESVVLELFTGGSKSPVEEPVWRYIDNSGSIQGPWTSKQMVSWYKQGYFDMNLLVVGCERKIAPPNLPKREEYLPLGKLLAQTSSKMPPQINRIKDASHTNGYGRKTGRR